MPLRLSVLAFVLSGGASPPRTPNGLAQCTAPLSAQASFAAKVGENIRYQVEVMGVNVGELEVQVARRGKFQGKPVTELNSIARINRSVGTFVPLEGAAAALVSDAGYYPVQASNRYRWMSLRSSELQTFQADGRDVRSKRVTSDGVVERHRQFHAPVHDMLTGFYFMRQLSPEDRGCAILFMNSKAYTVWIEADGTEMLDTGIGRLDTRRLKLRYASDDAGLVKEARIWLTNDGRRVPVRAEGLNRYKPRIDIRGYQSP